MKAMRNFWAREWLLGDIGSRHGTNDVSTIIKIAQTEGLLNPNSEMTDVGQSYVTAAPRCVTAPPWPREPPCA